MDQHCCHWTTLKTVSLMGISRNKWHHYLPRSLYFASCPTYRHHQTLQDLKSSEPLGICITFTIGKFSDRLILGRWCTTSRWKDVYQNYLSTMVALTSGSFCWILDFFLGARARNPEDRTNYPYAWLYFGNLNILTPYTRVPVYPIRPMTHK